MSNKRKQNTLDLKDKIEILKKLDSGENMCKLAKKRVLEEQFLDWTTP